MRVNAVVNIPTAFTILINLFIPYRLARFYCEFEPDGKRMYLFLVDTINYFFNFILDKRKIYQGVRVGKGSKKIIFEKTNLLNSEHSAFTISEDET